MAKTPIEAILDKIEYKPTGRTEGQEGLPYVTHEGILRLGEAELTVYVLNTGERIIPEEEIVKFFGFLDQND
jgi:hypothetical protein